MKYYYAYKITNKINNKIYIGIHETENIKDNYMGSGKAIKSAIKKYGIEHFEKEIIKFFDNRKELLNYEAEIVNEKFIRDPNTYNIALGGNSKGWDSMKGKVVVTDGDSTFSVDTETYYSLENLKHINADKVVCKDSNGNTYSINKNDIKLQTRTLVPINSGKVIAINPLNNKKIRVDGDDPRLKSGELTGHTKGRVSVKDENDNWITISKNDPDYISGKYKHHLNDTISVKDANGKIFRVKKDDPRFLAGELTGINKGKTMVPSKMKKCPYCNKQFRARGYATHIKNCKMRK